MTRPRLTVAEVIRSCLDEFLEQYGATLTPEQRRALKDLTACRTAALGGHVLGCPECGHQQIAYNSCGNRHCPTCQATAAARWLEARAAELLPVPYFHLVFTLPDALDPIALANPRVVYDLAQQHVAAVAVAKPLARRRLEHFALVRPEGRPFAIGRVVIVDPEPQVIDGDARGVREQVVDRDGAHSVGQSARCCRSGRPGRACPGHGA